MSELTDKNNASVSMLSCARELVTRLEEGNEERVIELVGALSANCENSLSRRVHDLVQELHESLNVLAMDSQPVALAEEEMQDTGSRLDCVVELAAQASQRTLTAVEHGLPVVEELCSQAGRMKAICDAMETDGASTASLLPRARELRSSVLLNAEALHGYLSDILMAQSFHNVTGPIIRRVVDLVQEVEQTLSALIGRVPVREEDTADCGSTAASGVAQDQGDTDGLLSKTGI